MFIGNPRLPPGNSLHKQAEIFCNVARVDNQMHMVGHQAKGVYLAVSLGS